jgi:putative efflux protein, MATE family
LLFSKDDLKRLLVPLLIEQILAITIGMVDTVMVASAGEAAVSGVSLVDSINFLLINLFSCLATGGAVVASQYLGRGDRLSAGKAGKLLLYACLAVGSVLGLFGILLNRPILRLVFGNIENDVMQSAQIYFLFSAIGYPFLSLYNANAALLRAQGNARASLNVALIINVQHVLCNALFIFVFKWGVFGAALSTLLSRLIGAALTSVTVLHKENLIPITNIRKFEWDKLLFGKILKIGLPTGFEGSFFQLGKLILASLTASFGTASLAANAITNNLASFQTIAGTAIGLGMVTVVGRCVGAKEYEQAKAYTKKLMFLTYAIIWAITIPSIFLLKPLIGMFNLSDEANTIAYSLMLSHSVFAVLTWPISFVLPNALRAAGDAKFTMGVACISMALVRVLMSFIFANTLGLGVLGIWLAMELDWATRGAAFVWRFIRGKWQRAKLI